MKRYFFAAVLAVLALVQVNADDTGRAFIRSAGGETPVAIRTAADATPAAPAPAKPVQGVVTGSACSSGGCNHCNCAAPVLGGDTRLGLHPFFSKLMWWKKPTCKKCGGLFGPRCNGGGYGFGSGAEMFNPYPDGVPGTLVFPQHPFVRSPRDFWMWEAK